MVNYNPEWIECVCVAAQEGDSAAKEDIDLILLS